MWFAGAACNLWELRIPAGLLSGAVGKDLRGACAAATATVAAGAAAAAHTLPVNATSAGAPQRPHLQPAARARAWQVAGGDCKALTLTCQCCALSKQQHNSLCKADRQVEPCEHLIFPTRQQQDVKSARRAAARLPCMMCTRKSCLAACATPCLISQQPHPAAALVGHKAASSWCTGACWCTSAVWPLSAQVQARPVHPTPLKLSRGCRMVEKKERQGTGQALPHLCCQRRASCEQPAVRRKHPASAGSEQQ